MLGEGEDKQGSGLHSWAGNFKKDVTIYFKKLCYYTHGSFVYFHFFWSMPQGMWDLSSLIRDQGNPCIGSVGS